MKLSFKKAKGILELPIVTPIVAETGESVEGVSECTVTSNLDGTHMHLTICVEKTAGPEASPNEGDEP